MLKLYMLDKVTVVVLTVFLIRILTILLKTEEILEKFSRFLQTVKSR
jgi:hypothetical protein